MSILHTVDGKTYDDDEIFNVVQEAEMELSDAVETVGTVISKFEFLIKVRDAKKADNPIIQDVMDHVKKAKKSLDEATDWNWNYGLYSKEGED